MAGENRKTLQHFTLDSIPTLEVAVFGALELLAKEGSELPQVPLTATRPLIVGSGNAHQAGKIFFDEQAAFFADESTYETMLDRYEEIDVVYIISASGKKHAIEMADYFHSHDLPVYLMTTNPDAPAATKLPDENVFVFPKNREPYTYNTSTYLSMIMAHTKEDPASIGAYINDTIAPKLLRNFECYSAFTLIVPAAFTHVVPMLRTKFDELFGPAVNGRVFTDEEIKHAKTVVQSGTELFVGIGINELPYGSPQQRMRVPLPTDADYGSVVAISYFLVGMIQRAHPPYFANNIVRYTEEAAQIFGHEIAPIVE